MSTVTGAAAPAPTLEESYARCRELNRRNGTTYYWSTMVLAKDKRPHVHALYAFCRYADDIVDDLGSTASTDERAAALADFGARFFADLERGDSDDSVLKAVVHTVHRWSIDPDCFHRFLRSMTMDLTVATYDTWADLLVYMDGSAAVIGEMMLPILEPTSPAATPHARDLGNGFQLTNFLRDVAEDLDRGRVYLPQEDLRRFGADPVDERRRVAAGGAVSAAWVELMRFEIARCEELYRSADLGIALLPERSARCIRSSRVLYSRIGRRIEAQGYDVFSRRARVPFGRKLALAAGVLLTPYPRRVDAPALGPGALSGGPR